MTQLITREPNPRYQACGLPSDMKLRAMGTGDKECVDCKKLHGKLRPCLKCDGIFQPGCRLRFICQHCMTYNSVH